jgi:undecaprenol kinase
MLMIILPLSGLERAVLILTIALVLSLELANTAAERVMDILKPRVHPYARVVKDAMAGAVLIAACAAVCIGMCILLPYF